MNEITNTSTAHRSTRTINSGGAQTPGGKGGIPNSDFRIPREGGGTFRIPNSEFRIQNRRELK
jgi:hypothetical protein